MRSDPATTLAPAEVLLGAIWRLSLVLALTAVAIALGLACKRWFAERARARKVARQAEIRMLVNALLASPREPDPTSLPPLRPGDEPALFSIALDILRVTRGRDADRMLRLTELWNLRPYLERVLRGNQRNRTIRVLTLLAHFRDAESFDLLLSHLNEDSIYVQLAALRGVAERGNVHHLPVVVAALTRARETNVPLLADILRRFGPSAVPALTGLAQGTAVAAVRLAATSALGGIGSLEAFDPLCALARDALPGVRVRALEALAQLGDPRAEDTVQRALLDDEERVRAAAAMTAGRLGLRETLPSLADALNDEAWIVRYRVAEALYRLGAPGVAVLRAIAAEADNEKTSEGRESRPGTDDIIAGLGPAMAAELLAEKEGVAA